MYHDTGLIFLLLTASESATDASDGAENMPVSSESNVYSVFGGEFVASKRGKPLGRERWVCCAFLGVLLLCLAAEVV